MSENDTDAACTSKSLVDVYANREQYNDSQQVLNMNFKQFATTFKVSNGKLEKLPDNAIPRIFPTYSCNPKGPNFALYCKYHFLRYTNHGEEAKTMLGMARNLLMKYSSIHGINF